MQVALQKKLSDTFLAIFPSPNKHNESGLYLLGISLAKTLKILEPAPFALRTTRVCRATPLMLDFQAALSP